MRTLTAVAAGLHRHTLILTIAVPLAVAAALLLFFHLPVAAQDNEETISGVTATSPDPGELVINWDAPARAPGDYRVTWRKSGANWRSYKAENTAEGGNGYPTGTTHTVTGLTEGAT